MANEKSESQNITASKAPTPPATSAPATTAPKTPAAPVTSTPATTTPKPPAAPVTSAPATTTPKPTAAPATSAPASAAPKAPATPAANTPKETLNVPAGEQIVLVRHSEIHDFKNHPFIVVNDDAMEELAESIKEVGVTTPCLLRPRKEGGYEMISGHRRKRGNELAGFKEIPCIIRNYDDDKAVKVMVLSNNQRVLTPMERANAYKMYLNACVHESQRGRRTDLGKTGGGEIGKEEALKLLGEKYKTTRSQILRYLSLSDLIPEFQKMVREEKLSVTPGAELGKLSSKDQKNAYNYLTFLDKSPSLSEVTEMRHAAKEGPLTDKKLRFLLDENYKGLIPEWQNSYMDNKIGDMPLDILVDFSEPNQREIFKASTELGKTITVPQLRAIEDKTKNRPFMAESIKSIIDPSYKPASQVKTDTQPQKSFDPSFSAKTNISEQSSPSATQSFSTDIPSNSHGAVPASVNTPSHEPTATPSTAPVHTTIPNSPASIPTTPPEPPAPKEPGIFIPLEKAKRYFPKTYTPEKIEESIYKVLDGWHKKREQNKAMSR